MGKSNRIPVKGSASKPVQTPGFGARLSEAALERQCSDLLALDGWRTLKTDPVSRREWGKGFGERGMADRLYIRYIWAGVREVLSEVEPERYAIAAVEDKWKASAEVLWIEFKRIRPRRNQPTQASPQQILWIAAERARGALVLLAGQDFPATFEGFTAWYAGSGLMRRAGLCR